MRPGNPMERVRIRRELRRALRGVNHFTYIEELSYERARLGWRSGG